VVREVIIADGSLSVSSDENNLKAKSSNFAGFNILTILLK